MNRRTFAMLACLSGLGLGCPSLARVAEMPAGPDFFTVIRERHSSRSFTDEPVSDADIEIMLRCAMQAPSAANERPWEFILIHDREMLAKVGEINSWARFARSAPLGILVCLDTQKEKEKGMGILDVGLCSENLMLAATALGLGSVFTGIYPYKDRMEGFSRLCSLPDFAEPIGLIVIGHPKIARHEPEDRFDPAAIHQNKW